MFEQTKDEEQVFVGFAGHNKMLIWNHLNTSSTRDMKTQYGLDTDRQASNYSTALIIVHRKP